MKKIVLFLLVLIIGVSCISSCGKKDDAPEGLQTADVSEKGGYIFYAPENWAVINAENISAAKVSQINNTSVTFTEANVPAATLPEYFDASMESLPVGIKDTLTVIVRDEKCKRHDGYYNSAVNLTFYKNQFQNFYFNVVSDLNQKDVTPIFILQ